MPFLSVIIPLYNKEKYIKKTIGSVLCQAFGDFEIIVVNDGSTDNSLQEVNEIKDCRIRIINQENSGVSAARNRGIKEANGKYVFFLDADDVLLGNAFDLCDELKDGLVNTDIYAASFVQKNSEGVVVNRKINLKSGKVEDAFKALFFKQLFLRTGTVFIKREIALGVGPMRSDITLYEDMEWLHRLLIGTTIYCSQQIILEYVRYENGLSSKMPDISKDFASIISLKNTKPQYRKNILGDFIFRRFVIRAMKKDWKGTKVILNNNGVRILYATLCFLYRSIITGSFKS